MKEDKLKEYLISLKSYDEEIVIDSLFINLKHKPSINLLRLRPNGIDGITTNNIKDAQEKFKHWNCE